MGWDRGRYYTRSKKVNGRVVRTYFGAGLVGELVAQMDCNDRQDREAAAVAHRHRLDELAALEAAVREVDHVGDLAARAALLTAGYRRHHRGDWRKLRGSA